MGPRWRGAFILALPDSLESLETVDYEMPFWTSSGSWAEQHCVVLTVRLPLRSVPVHVDWEREAQAPGPAGFGPLSPVPIHICMKTTAELIRGHRPRHHQCALLSSGNRSTQEKRLSFGNHLSQALSMGGRGHLTCTGQSEGLPSHLLHFR